MAAGAGDSTAFVPTDRAARYGKQLASHLGHRLTTEWHDESATGVVRFDAGVCDLTATPDGLAMVIDLSEALPEPARGEQLDRIEDVVGRHLIRFGAKDELLVDWSRS